MMRLLPGGTPIFLLLVCVTLGLGGCDGSVTGARGADGHPDIFPDYVGVTVPANIAPLNFGMRGEGWSRIEVHFAHRGETVLRARGGDATKIPLKEWRRILAEAAGESLQVTVHALGSGEWSVWQPFDIHIAADPIDPYIAYRLIEPGYELWDKMGIYQRDLTTFEQSPVVVNQLNGGGCLNCHSFHDHDPGRMMFHSRGEGYAGTFVLADGEAARVNTRTESAPSAATYPAWHPSGDYIAFSSNNTRQSFHAALGKRVEVYDLASDLVVMDVKKGTMLRDSRLTTEPVWETFPTWSPDGKWLYYCAAEARDMPFGSEDLAYGLYRVEFDAATGRFGSRTDTLVNPAAEGKSVSFPRISPDGRYLLYTASGYATFPIWHGEADLEMNDLSDGSAVDIGVVNSDEAESYHSWSSNGRWVVFSSRRIDGLHTRPFFAYFDASGKMHKPFLLPQKDPEQYYTMLLQSYNIPEFVKGRIEIDPAEVGRILGGPITDLKEITQ